MVDSVSMPATGSATGGGISTVIDRVLFLKQLQALSNRIHSTDRVEEWQLDMAQDICELLQADRMTLYEVDPTGRELVSRIKTGLSQFKDIRLPVDDRSVAGFVGATRQVVNISDVYDSAELRRIAPSMKFLKEVDSVTGYRSRQMLVLPLSLDQQLFGVIQLMNFKGTGAFPQIVQDGARELAQTLSVALRRRRQRPETLRTPWMTLVEDGTLGRVPFETAQRSAREAGRSLQAVLAEDHRLPLGVLGAALSRFYGVAYEPFRENSVKVLDLRHKLRRDFAETQLWLPIDDGPQGLVIVCTDPDHVRNSRMVNNIFPKRPIDYRVTTEAEFGKLLRDFFDDPASSDSVTDLLSGLQDGDETTETGADEVTDASDNELVRLVNRIIVEAHQQGASDIHIEPRPGRAKTIVRLRKDGALINYIEVPAAFRNALVTRLKIMCDLDISERRRPQDGKIKFRRFGPLDIELRVATLPTAGGTEDVVMRILAAGEPLPLDRIGLSPRNHRGLQDCVGKPYGLFLVCGPTGSGKTTTLHSVLHHLNRPETKIWTAEDPVEITQNGLRQVQVNRKAGIDFVTIMRAFLRADPDVIMVGEMRDTETAGTAVEASLTGHLVLSTLHTNSAVESVVRLLDMGMEPFNFADALLGVLAQRLARRVCKDCRQAYQPDAAELEQLLSEYCAELTRTPAWAADPAAARASVAAEWRQYDVDGAITLYRAQGCPACQGTGYRGRIGLHELLVGSDEVKQLIQQSARVPEILACALGQGMRTLKMDGIEKVLQGFTDMKQVRSVCLK